MKNRSHIGRKLIVCITIICVIVLIAMLFVSYFFLIPPLRNKEISSMQSINTEIASQTDDYLSSIINYADLIASDRGLSECYNNYLQYKDKQYFERMCLEMNRIANEKDDIVSVFLQDDNGNLFNSVTQTDCANPHMLDSKWYNSIVNGRRGHSFLQLGIVKTSTLDAYIVAYCENCYINSHKMTMTIFFRINEIIDFTKRVLNKNADYYIWLDEKGSTLFGKRDTEWTEMVKKRLSGNNNYYFGTFYSHEGYNFVSTCQQSGWRIVSYLSSHDVFEMMKNYYYTLLTILVLFMFLVILSVSITAKKVTEPISELAMVMGKVAKGDFNVKSDIQTNDEIGELSSIFNHMIMHIKEYMKILVEKEKTEQKMKYNLMISRMDPHFIYNTMNTINFLARKGENEDVIKINSALIKILQDRLRVENDNAFDTVGQEINMVKQYMIIQNYRYGNDVKVIYNVDEKLYDFIIPKSIIQPLVENALFYGFTSEDDWNLKGTLNISVKRKDDKYIIIKVQDDGRGIPPDKLKVLNESVDDVAVKDRGRHIGLSDIKKRLAYIYHDNENYMKIISKVSEGTCVTLTIKILEQNSKDQ